MKGPARRFRFEPQKKVFRELVYNLRLNELDHATPLRFAVSSEPGFVEMNPVEKKDGRVSIGQGGDSVEARTIDSFGFTNVSLIKIDVEGFEDPVLRGAMSTIHQNRPALLVEIQGSHHDKFPPPEVREKIRRTAELIRSMGYELSLIDKYNYVCIPSPAARR